MTSADMGPWDSWVEQLTGEGEDLPKLPENLIDWTLTSRPFIDGKKYSFLAYPMWKEIYESEAYQLMVMAGRQTTKSTWFTNVLGNLATTQPESVGIYVSHDDLSVGKFSHKFRQQTLNKNPMLRTFCSGKKTGLPGQVGKVEYKTASITYMVSDESEFTHVESASPNVVCIDEAQYCDLEHLHVVYEAMSHTFGKLRFAGIGGELGSELWRLWKQTTQSEWRYKNKHWYEKLKFDSKGELIVEKYLEDVLDGKWIMNEPKNREFPGYHIPQTIMPHIPQRKVDAIKRRLPVRFSVEYKIENYPKTRREAHVMGGFYEAQRRPLTEEDIRACMDPYSYQKLIDPSGPIDGSTGILEEIVELKWTYGKRLKILMGVDFGSGKAGRSATVIMILLRFKGKTPGFDRYMMTHVEIRDGEDPDDQAEYINYLFRIFGCDIGVGDLGYGMDRIKKIQDGGYSKSGLYLCGRGEFFKGLGSIRFVGCRTVDREQQAVEYKEREMDEHGEESEQIIIDKTQALDQYVSFIKWFTPHPGYPEQDAFDRPKLMIPYFDEGKVEWLIKDMSALIRKDLEEVIDVEVPDERSKARKQYNHPKDVIMACVYNLVADNQPEPDFGVGGIHVAKNRPGPGGTPRRLLK